MDDEAGRAEPGPHGGHVPPHRSRRNPRLKGPGLRAQRRVRLVIADEHAGLAAAVRTHLPDAEPQRCIVHLQRNVLTKAPQRHRKRLARDVAEVFKAASLKDAKTGFAAATRFYAFPKAHWRRIRSINGLERLHGEIKRRTRAVGVFPNRASALRLITAVALDATSTWSTRRYLDMTLLDGVANPAQEELPEAA